MTGTMRDGDHLPERHGEPNTELEMMRVRLESLERQQSAVTQLLQRQDELAQLLESLNRKLNEFHEWRAFASDVNSRFSALSEDVKRLDAAVKLIPINPLDGIIRQLTRQCGGNVHALGVVEVTSSSVFDKCNMQGVVALEAENWWSATNDFPDQWICLDFKGARVAPTSYSIRTGDTNFLRSWEFEVSNDRVNWQQVDQRHQALEGQYVTYNFAISNPPTRSFRFVRLRQTGPNSCGNNHLNISALEIFGTLSSQ